MSELATVQPQAVIPAQKPPRPVRISKPVRQAIELLESGECKTQKAAAERAGITDNWLCKQLRNPTIQAFIARRRAENIARGTLRASARIGGLVDAASEHVALHASRLLLETSGDLKSSAPGGVNVSINNHMQAGYVIDLSERPRNSEPEEAARIINPSTPEGG